MHEKRYEIETPGETLTRMDMLIRQMYYLERDAETKGESDHESLKMYTDAILYTVLDWERRVKKKSVHKPACPENMRPKVHGLEKRYTDRLVESVESFYIDLRSKVNDRIYHENTKR